MALQVRDHSHRTHLPSDVYPNAYFEQQLDTTDAWIRSRTGLSIRLGSWSADGSPLADRRPEERRSVSPQPHLFASPSTPESVAQDALDRSERGE